MSDENGYKQAMFGAGCFWGVQSFFDDVKGVVETEVGYAGGSARLTASGSTHSIDSGQAVRLRSLQAGSPQAAPTYKEVCTGKTGHAEVVHLKFDPSIVSYEELLKVFFDNHDPATLNRQGPDRGSQYRSIIFYYDENQRDLAEKYKEQISQSGQFMNKIVTEIVPASPFYRAEEYHQKYFEKTGKRVCH